MTTARITIVDDWYPRLDTGFRIAEFGWLLKTGTVEQVLTTNEPLDELLEKYRDVEPDYFGQVHEYKFDLLRNADLAYVLFLNNAVRALPDFESLGLPFVCALYPGGGLNFEDEVAVERLKMVLSSPLLRAVITTQHLVTHQIHVLSPELPLIEIPGVVVSTDYLSPGAGLREDYPADRSGELVLGFMAHRYSHDGRDKGFPEFLEILKLLRDRGLSVTAQVIGGFDRALVTDLGHSPLLEHLDLHGTLTGSDLRKVLGRMHAVISPNRPGVTARGVFDGFPTASVIEASLCGAAMVVSDELEQNTFFHDGFDIVIEQPSPEAMAHRIEDLLGIRGGLRDLAHAGLRQTRRRYSVNAQLVRRREVLTSAAERSY